MRIAIVEDEPRIREGLARLIGKISCEYEVVGEASGGVEGERMILETTPDLVITDVRMPDLDGLEMLDRLQRKGRRPKAIVLSAFSEFSYAREAIKLGVSEYILKPLDVGDLTRALKHIEERIEDEERSERNAGRVTLEGFLYSIMIGGADVDADTLVSLSRECMVTSPGRFVLATVYIGTCYENESRRAIQLAKATLLPRHDLEWRIIELPRSKRFSVFCFKVKDADSLQYWFAHHFLPRMRESGIADLCVGCGSFNDLDELRSTTLGIDESLDWIIALGNGTLIVWPEVDRTQFEPLRYPVALEGEVRAALCAVDRPRYETGISDFMGRLREGGIHSPRDMKNSFVRFFWSVLNTARAVDFEGYASLDQQDMLESIRFAVSWSELEKSAAILRKLFRMGSDAPQSDGFIVARAKNIIQEFFSQGITLNEAASYISVTPEYLSSRFHQETGITFSAYIRDFRIQKAKELLIGTALRLGDIGDRVGYKDAKYFCRVFKEATGMNPSDYRKANR